jgi:hypothetical protein
LQPGPVSVHLLYVDVQSQVPPVIDSKDSSHVEEDGGVVAAGVVPVVACVLAVVVVPGFIAMQLGLGFLDSFHFPFLQVAVPLQDRQSPRGSSVQACFDKSPQSQLPPATSVVGAAMHRALQDAFPDHLPSLQVSLPLQPPPLTAHVCLEHAHEAASLKYSISMSGGVTHVFQHFIRLFGVSVDFLHVALADSHSNPSSILKLQESSVQLQLPKSVNLVGTSSAWQPLWLLPPPCPPACTW